jgi:hypothetical protein
MNQPNKDFFDSTCKEFIINSTGMINLFFGCTPDRYHKFNDVVIIPKDNAIVKVIVKLKGVDTMNFEVSERLDINQRCSTEYSFVDLFIGEIKVYNKQDFYEGTIIIDGKCDIIQKPEWVIDY